MLPCLLIAWLAAEAAPEPAGPKLDAKAIRARALARAHADSLPRQPAPAAHGHAPGSKPRAESSPPPRPPATGDRATAPSARHGEEAPTSAHGGHADAPEAHAKVPDGELHGEKASPEGASGHRAETAAGHGTEPKAGAHGKAPEAPAPPRVPACGEIPRSATWKKPDFVLNRTLKVPAGMTLWISRGTRIRLGPRDSCQASPAPVGIVVAGRLVIEGDAWNPVVVEPAPGTKAWDGITVLGSSRIDHLRLRGARTGLRLHGSRNEVSSSLIEDCVTGVQVSGGASGELSHLVITRSQGAGLYVNRASPHVRGSLFLQNRGIAAWFEGSGLARLENNAFWGNLQGEVAGTARWGRFSGKGPVKSDADGNLLADPVLVGSPRDNAWKDSLARAGRRPGELPFGDPPWALSGVSPLRGKGPRLLKRPWIRTDIGLYGLDID